MAVSLAKGSNVSLSQSAPGLKKILIGLGWDARATDGQDFDLDASIFLLKENSKVRNEDDFIFYNNLISECQSVEHTGDNRTGEGDGDDESIKIDLSRVPTDITRIAVSVTIDEADARRQNFGQVGGEFREGRCLFVDLLKACEDLFGDVASYADGQANAGQDVIRKSDHAGHA